MKFKISVLFFTGLLACLPATALASITKRFNTSEQLVVGSLVSVPPTQPDTVVGANASNVSSLYGVVTEVDVGSVQVADSETSQTLVSTINGDVHAGDPITASVLSGVGQRATLNTRIIGYAQSPFTKSTSGGRTQTFRDQSGKAVSVLYGPIPVLLGPVQYQAPTTPNPNPNAAPPVSGGVQKFFNSVAGHEVVPNRIILALFLIAISLVIVSVIVSTSVRRSLTAIGRNPLSSHSLLRALTHVVLAVLALLGAAMGGAYLIVTH